MSLPHDMRRLADEIIESFVARKHNLQGVRGWVEKLRIQVALMLAHMKKERERNTALLREGLFLFKVRLEKEVNELLKKYEQECERNTVLQREELYLFKIRLQEEVQHLLAKYEAELAETDAIWAEMEATLDKLRREDP